MLNVASLLPKLISYLAEVDGVSFLLLRIRFNSKNVCSASTPFPQMMEIFKPDSALTSGSCKIYSNIYAGYRKESFPSKESDTKILQRMNFAYWVGIISSYSNRNSNIYVCFLTILHNVRSSCTTFL